MQTRNAIMFFKSEVEKAIKEMKDKKAIADVDVREEVLKVLGEEGPRIMIQLMNNIYQTGEWLKDFIEFTIITLKKKSEATKCSDHCTPASSHVQQRQ